MTNDSSTATVRLTPPTGGFQEIDGRRVFVHRAGSGGPAAVFFPGASEVGLDFFLVQQQVSRFTAAVLYDRGGTGFSDPVPLPRTAAAVATELHELLCTPGHRRPLRSGGALPRRRLRAPVRAAVPARGGRAGLVGRLPAGLGRLHARRGGPGRGRADDALSGAGPAGATGTARDVRRPAGGLPGRTAAAADRGPRERRMAAGRLHRARQPRRARGRATGRTGLPRRLPDRAHDGGHRPGPAGVDLGSRPSRDIGTDDPRES